MRVGLSPTVEPKQNTLVHSVDNTRVVSTTFWKSVEAGSVLVSTQTYQVEEMREKRKAGVLIKDLMKEYGLSKASVYRLMAG